MAGRLSFRDIAHIMAFADAATAKEMRLVAQPFNTAFIVHLCSPAGPPPGYCFRYVSVAETLVLFQRYPAVALRMRECVKWPFMDYNAAARGDPVGTHADRHAFSKRLRESLVRARFVDAPWRWLLYDAMPPPLPPLPTPPWPERENVTFLGSTTEAEKEAYFADRLAEGHRRVAAREAETARRAAEDPPVALCEAPRYIDTLALTRSVVWWPSHVLEALVAALLPRRLVIKCIGLDEDMQRYSDYPNIFSNNYAWERNLCAALAAWPFEEVSINVAGRMRNHPCYIREMAAALARNAALASFGIASDDVLLALSERTSEQASDACKFYGPHEHVVTLELSHSALALNEALVRRGGKISDVNAEAERAERSIPPATRFANLAARFPFVTTLRVRAEAPLRTRHADVALLADLAAAFPRLERLEYVRRPAKLPCAKPKKREYAPHVPGAHVARTTAVAAVSALDPSGRRAAAARLLKAK